MFRGTHWGQNTEVILKNTFWKCVLPLVNKHSVPWQSEAGSLGSPEPGRVLCPARASHGRWQPLGSFRFAHHCRARVSTHCVPGTGLSTYIVLAHLTLTTLGIGPWCPHLLMRKLRHMFAQDCQLIRDRTSIQCRKSDSRVCALTPYPVWPPKGGEGQGSPGAHIKESPSLLLE